MKIKKVWNVKTDGDQSQIDLFGYVGGSKDWDSGFNEEDLLKELRAIPTENALNISINSFGGSVFTALSIYSLLQAHKGPITFRIDGAAMSAATIITSVPGAKVIMPMGSMMMIHKVSSIAIGNADDMRKTADDMEKLEQNLVDIYVAKTGKSAEEIQEKVNAETYFTAREAVEFGLADEVDETRQIENKQSGDIVTLNGLEVRASHFEHAPKGFFKADTPKASAVKEEVQIMNLEQLKAEHPDLVEAIRKEGVQAGIAQERARMQSIDDLGVVGFDNLVNAAKFENGQSAEQLAVAVLKAQKGKVQNVQKAIVDDAKVLEGLGNEGDPTDKKGDIDERQKLQDHLANICKYEGGQ